MHPEGLHRQSFKLLAFFHDIFFFCLLFLLLLMTLLLLYFWLLLVFIYSLFFSIVIVLCCCSFCNFCYLPLLLIIFTCFAKIHIRNFSSSISPSSRYRIQKWFIYRNHCVYNYVIKIAIISSKVDTFIINNYICFLMIIAFVCFVYFWFYFFMRDFNIWSFLLLIGQMGKSSLKSALVTYSPPNPPVRWTSRSK